jgi:hypothetical protein
MNFRAIAACTAVLLASTLAFSQTSMGGKTCLGTFAIANANASSEWDQGAIRVTFNTSSAGSVDAAAGIAAFREPQKVQSFNTSAPFTNAVYAGNRLTLKTERSSLDATGDGTTFTGTNDARPIRKYVANIKMTCR